MGTVALVAAVMGQEVENDGCGRCSGDQIAHPPRPGAEPVLQRAEVEPAGPPDHEFPVEDHAFVELGHRGGDVWEACDEFAELRGLQVHTVIVAEGQRPEPSYFGSNDHPGPTGSWVTVFVTHRLQ
jgi:hypothetical protein